MNLIGLENRSIESSHAADVDLLLCASGYETRARYFPEQLFKKTRTSFTRKVVWAFSEHRDAGAREANDRFYTKNGFEFFEFSESDSAGVFEHFSELIDSVRRESAKIVVDISSMSRAWYGALIHALKSRNWEKELQIEFFYSQSIFFRSSDDYPPNQIVSPVPGFGASKMPDKPTAVIIALGIDRGRALGLVDHLDPGLILAFYASPAANEEHEYAVRKYNSELFDIVRPENVFRFPINDPVATFRSLESVCFGVMKDWRVVLASIGPKLISLIFFLAASKLDEVSVWRVSAGKMTEPEDLLPNGKIVGLKTFWKD